MFSKNQIVELWIEDIGTEGEGIGKADGYTLFVKGAVAGDYIRARIMKVGKTYGYARIEEILTASKDRVTPVCDKAGRCGGCQLQQLSYEAQLVFKQNKVKNCLQRIGGIEVEEVSEKDIVVNAENVADGDAEKMQKMDESKPAMYPILGMKEPYYYRNKAQYPVGRNKEGRIVTGFYAGRTHSIIETETCAIQAPVNEVLLATVRQFMEEYKISPYDEETNKGLVRHILTRVGFVTGEIMVCLVINGTKLPHAQELVSRLQKAVKIWNEKNKGNGLLCENQFKDAKLLKSVCLNVNREKTNVILGDTVLPLFGETYITDYIGDISYRISPLSFYQVNPTQTKVLYDTALTFADLHGDEIVWDLYCGIGTISLFLAKQAKQVYGVEIIPQAIQDAKENAVRNHITNAEFFVGAAEDVLPAKYKESNGSMRADVIVVDPPRKGCDQALLATIVAMEPKRVVYVSCDPATLARDLKYLQENGYEVKKVQAVDQFPQGVHVETVALLSLKTNQPTLEVTMEVDSDSNYTPEERATYQKIKAYVKDKYGVNVHTSYIAQVKRMCGLDMGENYNKSKKENPEVKQCPQEKVEYIKDALEHFGLL